VTGALLVLACASPEPPRATGFLGDYAALRPEEGSPPDAPDPSLLFIAQDADFASRDEVLVEPVTVWRSVGASEDPALYADLEHLADRFELALRSHLEQDFVLVERPGPTTLRLRIAITEVPRADAAVGIVSTLPPRSARFAPDTALAPATRAFLAGAAVEAEALDALTNRRLAAAVDPQAVPRLIERDATRWGDVEQAWDAWADGLQAALAAFRRTGSGGDPADSPAAP